MLYKKGVHLIFCSQTSSKVYK